MSRGCDYRWDSYQNYSYPEENQYLDQDQLQAQIQAQIQAQLQDQDQDQRTVFRGVGNSNVHIRVDNESIAVALLVALGVLTGALDSESLRTYITQFTAR